MTTLVITRPNYEKTTYYLFHWNKKVIASAKAKQITVIDLSEEKANKKNLTNALTKKKPELVILNGHGSEDLITGQNDEVLIKANENEDLLKGKVVYALSCKTAKVLGPASIQKGTKAYIGYKEDFTFWFKSSRPLKDKWACLFLEPSNAIPLGLIKGHSIEEVFLKAKSLYLKNIRNLIATGSTDNFLIPDLVWDMNNLIILGNFNFKV